MSVLFVYLICITAGELRLHKGSSVTYHNMALSGKKGFGLHLKVGFSACGFGVGRGLHRCVEWVWFYWLGQGLCEICVFDRVVVVVVFVVLEPWSSIASSADCCRAAAVTPSIFSRICCMHWHLLLPTHSQSSSVEILSSAWRLCRCWGRRPKQGRSVCLFLVCLCVPSYSDRY